MTTVQYNYDDGRNKVLTFPNLSPNGAIANMFEVWSICKINNHDCPTKSIEVWNEPEPFSE